MFSIISLLTALFCSLKCFLSKRLFLAFHFSVTMNNQFQPIFTPSAFDSTRRSSRSVRLRLRIGDVALARLSVLHRFSSRHSATWSTPLSCIDADATDSLVSLATNFLTTHFHRRISEDELRLATGRERRGQSGHLVCLPSDAFDVHRERRAGKRKATK